MRHPPLTWTFAVHATPRLHREELRENMYKLTEMKKDKEQVDRVSLQEEL